MQNAKNNEEAFLLFADAVNQEKDASSKALLASRLLGKSGGKMTKFFAGGSDAIKGLMDEQLSYGVISENNVSQCENFNDAMERITSAGIGLKNVVIGALIPGITKLATKTSDFIKNNQKLINMFGKMISAIIPWLPAIIGVVGGLKLLQNGVVGFRIALKTTQIIMPILQKEMKALAPLGQKLFNLLTAANPIGLIVLGVVALFTILILNVKNFAI